MFGEDTIDNLIYPRLRLKSEVIATVVDGKQEDKTFKIAEAEDVSQQKLLDKIQARSYCFVQKNGRRLSKRWLKRAQEHTEGEDGTGEGGEEEGKAGEQEKDEIGREKKPISDSAGESSGEERDSAFIPSVKQESQR